jgi:hypothetical protein
VTGDSIVTVFFSDGGAGPSHLIWLPFTTKVLRRSEESDDLDGVTPAVARLLGYIYRPGRHSAFVSLAGGILRQYNDDHVLDGAAAIESTRAAGDFTLDTDGICDRVVMAFYQITGPADDADGIHFGEEPEAREGADEVLDDRIRVDATPATDDTGNIGQPSLDAQAELAPADGHGASEAMAQSTAGEDEISESEAERSRRLHESLSGTASSRTQWTEEEDQQLRDVLSLPDAERAAALQHFPGRGRKACERRWSRLRRQNSTSQSQLPFGQPRPSATGAVAAASAPNVLQAQIPIPPATVAAAMAPQSQLRFGQPRPSATGAVAAASAPNVLQAQIPIPPAVVAGPGVASGLPRVFVVAQNRQAHAGPGRDDMFRLPPDALGASLDIRGAVMGVGEQLTEVGRAVYGADARVPAMLTPFGMVFVHQ